MQLVVMKGTEENHSSISVKGYHLAAVFVSLLLLGISLFVSGMLLSANFGDQLPVIRGVEQSRLIERELEGKGSTAPLDAMAIRLAELQAHVARLNAIGKRLLEDSGMDASDLEKEPTPGQGGLFLGESDQSMSFTELTEELAVVSDDVSRHADILSVIDADLRLAKVQFQRVPSSTPVSGSFRMSSRFGKRIDPFKGRRARHNGIDYAAPKGTPILSAAAGVVVRAGFHGGYGYLVDVEHSDNVITRYAHASKLLVHKGDIVKVGQEIALVGSTGRSTGPHLHFEVRVNGKPKNPVKFLAKDSTPRAGAVTVSALNSLFSGKSSREIN